MRKKFCDRCGKELPMGDGEPVVVVGADRMKTELVLAEILGGMTTVFPLDICDTCRKELKMWWELKP